jgi:hypothetical protein
MKPLQLLRGTWFSIMLRTWAAHLEILGEQKGLYQC